MNNRVKSGLHRSLEIPEEVSGATEEKAPSVDRPHPLVEIRYTRLHVVKASIEMTV
jgi:hypothetical protein